MYTPVFKIKLQLEKYMYICFRAVKAKDKYIYIYFSSGNFFETGSIF